MSTAKERHDSYVRMEIKNWQRGFNTGVLFSIATVGLCGLIVWMVW